MKLRELKEQVDFVLSQMREGDEDLEVVIPNPFTKSSVYFPKISIAFSFGVIIIILV